MTSVHLHVGMPKCASSTVQSYFHSHDARHRSEGLCYPQTCRTTGGYFNHLPLHSLPPEELGPAVDAIAREAEGDGCDRILVSSEGFTNALWGSSITTAVIAALNATFGEQNVHVVMLFRNHFSFVESAYAQFLKGGLFGVHPARLMHSGDSGISGYAAQFRRNNGFDFFSYADFIERFRGHAPRNPIELYSCESADNDGKDITEVLSGRLGVSYGQAPAFSNTRFSDTALLLLRHSIQAHGVTRTRERREIIAGLFPSGEKEFSEILHVGGPLFDRVQEASDRDRGYFQRHCGRTHEHVFDIPPAYMDRRDRRGGPVLADWCLQLTDRVMKAEKISMAGARKLKEDLAPAESPGAAGPEG